MDAKRSIFFFFHHKQFFIVQIYGCVDELTENPHELCNTEKRDLEFFTFLVIIASGLMWLKI